MIELISRKERDKARQIAFIKVTDEAHGIDAQEFSVGNVPVELTDDKDVQAHLDSREEEIITVILRKHYPEADISQFREEGKSELEAFTAWIDNGCKNKIQIGLTATGKPKYGYEVIEKKEIEYRHPPELAVMDKIDKASIDPNLKSLLKDITMR